MVRCEITAPATNHSVVMAQYTMCMFAVCKWSPLTSVQSTVSDKQSAQSIVVFLRPTYRLLINFRSSSLWLKFPFLNLPPFPVGRLSRWRLGRKNHPLPICCLDKKFKGQSESKHFNSFLQVLCFLKSSKRLYKNCHIIDCEIRHRTICFKETRYYFDGQLNMGARQSVAQSPDQATPDGDQSLTTLSSNGHTSTNQASTSAGTSSGLGGARPRLVLQPSSSSSTHRQPRQTRSRSMTTSPPQFQADAAALIAAMSQQRRRANRLLVESAIGGGSSDQSSDSGDDNDAMTASTLRSLDRLLRFNSVTNATSDAHASSTTPRIWLPPVSFHRYFDIKCPICNKSIPFDDAELHLVVCLTRPKIAYNEEVLCEDRDECVICFDEMSQGDTIARLPCLCVYHKTCIDGWFKVKNCCPAHPGDD